MLWTWLTLSSSATKAEDRPCQREDDRVVCTATGFDKLVDLTVIARGEAQRCGLRLTECTESLKACEVPVPPVPSEPMPSSTWRPVSGYIMGVVGAAALGLVVGMDMPTSVRSVVGSVGLAFTASGVLLVLP